MRLTAKQITGIQTAAQEVFTSAVDVRLFGSRLDEQRRGGDIDLLVEPAHPLSANELIAKRTRFIARLYRLIGEQRIDVLIAPSGQNDDRAVVISAREHGEYLFRGIA
ncbi:MAG: nucleotidyltransferase domain-containing protein [Fluviibacter sp.]